MSPASSLASRPLILLIGAAGDDELRPVAAWLNEAAFPDFELEPLDAERLGERLAGRPPELVVVLQRWPDEFSAKEADAVLARWPLARVVCVSGPWCDSDGRTREHWPLVTRAPAATAIERLRRELDGLRRQQPGLPATASRTETFAALSEASPGGARTSADSTRGLCVRLISADGEFAGAIADLCASWGWTIDERRSGVAGAPPPDVVLWDADPLPAGSDADGWERLLARGERLAEESAGAAVLVFAGFARQGDVARLTVALNAVVVPKLSSGEAVRSAVLATVGRRG